MRDRERLERPAKLRPRARSPRNRPIAPRSIALPSIRLAKAGFARILRIRTQTRRARTVRGACAHVRLREKSCEFTGKTGRSRREGRGSGFERSGVALFANRRGGDERFPHVLHPICFCNAPPPRASCRLRRQRRHRARRAFRAHGVDARSAQLPRPVPSALRCGPRCRRGELLLRWLLRLPSGRRARQLLCHLRRPRLHPHSMRVSPRRTQRRTAETRATSSLSAKAGRRFEIRCDVSDV